MTLPLVLLMFTAFCVMVGLHWSIKSKGTISSVVVAVLVVGAIAGVLGLCGIPAGKEIQIVGALFTAVSPMNLLFAIVYPAETIPKSMADPVAGRTALAIGAVIASAIYIVVVYGMHTTMKRSFMMTVRRLAGAA